MRFHAEQQFEASAEAVFSLYTDARLYEALDGLPKIGRPEVLGHDTRGDTTIVRVRYHFAASLPSAALAVIDPKKLSWVDETTYERTTLTASTRLLPDHYPDRLAATARGAFLADADRPGCSRRRIDGELSVRMLLVGGQVERAIVSGLQEHLVDEARVANGLLGS